MGYGNIYHQTETISNESDVGPYTYPSNIYRHVCSLYWTGHTTIKRAVMGVTYVGQDTPPSHIYSHGCNLCWIGHTTIKQIQSLE